MKRIISAAFAVLPMICGPAPAKDWSVFIYEKGEVYFTGCDYPAVTLAFTPAYSTGAQNPGEYIARQVASRVEGWSADRASIEHVASSDDSIMLEFDGRHDRWQAWFYSHYRPDTTEWAVVVAPSFLTEADEGIAEARRHARSSYGQGRSVRPDALPRSGYGAGAVPAGALTGRLRSSTMKWMLGGDLSDRRRDYLLIQDGRVAEVEPTTGNAVALGRWRKNERGYEIDWNSGAFESVPESCFAAGAPALSEVQPHGRDLQDPYVASDFVQDLLPYVMAAWAPGSSAARAGVPQPPGPEVLLDDASEMARSLRAYEETLRAFVDGQGFTGVAVPNSAGRDLEDSNVAAQFYVEALATVSKIAERRAAASPPMLKPNLFTNFKLKPFEPFKPNPFTTFKPNPLTTLKPNPFTTFKPKPSTASSAGAAPATPPKPKCRTERRQVGIPRNVQRCTPVVGYTGTVSYTCILVAETNYTYQNQQICD